MATISPPCAIAHPHRRSSQGTSTVQSSITPSTTTATLSADDEVTLKGRLNTQPSLTSRSEGGPVKNDDPPTRMGPAPWTECSAVIKDCHEAMVRRWKEEIDTLLVYGGLFSAVLTAFNVELYSALQPSPTDTTNAVLSQMAAQLNSFTLSSSFANSSQPYTPLPPPSSFRPLSSSVWINALWFSSLICSLSSACIGMMVKQWLHETELGLPGTSHETARLRQYRLDALVKWRVGMIVALLPILLLFASALFLAGLLTLLWTLHHGVAAMASVLVGTLLVFTLVTLVLPAFSSDCAYRSPQALILLLLVQVLCRFSRYLLRPMRQVVYLRSSHSRAWRCISRYLEAVTLARWGNYRSWSGLERVVVQDRQHLLDQHAVETANRLRLDDGFTDRVLRPCIGSLPARYAYQCFRRVHSDRVRHTGGHYDCQPAIDTAVTLALDVVDLHLDSVEPDAGAPQLRVSLRGLVADMRALPHNMVSARVSERLYSTLVRVLQRGDAEGRCAYDVYSMLDCVTSTKWVLGALSDIACGEAVRDVTSVLEGLCGSDSSLPIHRPRLRELVTFLGTCCLRPGFFLPQDRDFVRMHLHAALDALEAYLTRPSWASKGEHSLIAVELVPLLEELHAQVPGSVTSDLVAAMERATSGLAEICSSDGK